MEACYKKKYNKILNNIRIFMRSIITGIASMFGEMGFVSENASPDLKGLIISVCAMLIAFLFNNTR